MIRAALKVCFGEKPTPKITYIVVNKNTELQYLPPGPDAPSAQLNQDFVIEQGKAKYRYYVVCDDSNMIPGHLEQIVSFLSLVQIPALRADFTPSK